MLNNSDFEKAVELIGKSKDVLITTHTRPDGDACGAVLAMSEALGELGKNAKILMLSEVPQWYGFLFEQKPAVLGEDINIEQLKEGHFGQFDLVILLDVNSSSQLPEFGEYLKQNDTPTLVLDHHVTSDGLGDVELVDTSAAAAGLIVLELLKYASWEISEKIARAIFIAIATDTGWFKFGNTDSRVHRACAELIEAGVESAKVYHRLYQNFSHQRFELMTAMLGTLELHLDGRFASQYLLQQDFERTGAAYSDTENLIDECQRISTVEAAALFVESQDGRIKCSLRSKGAVDVSKIAQRFGGGGHKAAAGAHLDGPLENAKQLVLEQVREQFVNLQSGKETTE